MGSEISDGRHETFGLFTYRLATQPGEVLKNPHIGVDCVLDALSFATPQVQAPRKRLAFADYKWDVPLHVCFLSALWVRYIAHCNMVTFSIDNHPAYSYTSL